MPSQGGAAVGDCNPSRRRFLLQKNRSEPIINARAVGPLHHMASPQQFGKYTLMERIAVGGMAEIYRAKTFGAAGFEKELVIKRILPQFSADDDFVHMFIDEARIAARLQHANI